METILVGAALAIIVAAIIGRGVYNRLHGRGGCSCGGDCASCGGCASRPKDR